MNTLLSNKLATGGLRALPRWSAFVVVGLLPGACDGDNDGDNQLPLATVDALPTTKIMTEKKQAGVLPVLSGWCRCRWPSRKVTRESGLGPYGPVSTPTATAQCGR